jgi:hypothetical protein
MVCSTIHNIGSYHAEAPGDQDMFDYLKRCTDSGTISARVGSLHERRHTIAQSIGNQGKESSRSIRLGQHPGSLR